MGQNISTPPSTIPQAVQWLVQNLQVLNGRVNKLSNSSSSSVTTDSTLTGSGTLAFPLGINLSNPNNWIGVQTFSASIQTGVNGSVQGGVTLFGPLGPIVLQGTTTSTPAGWTLTLPANAGTPSQFLQTDGTGVTSWGNVSGTIQTVQVSLSSAQILNINTTPVQLVPAPGAGYVIKVLGFMWDYTFVSVAYSSTNLFLYEGNTANVYGSISASLISAGASAINDISPFTIGASSTFSAAHVLVDNAALMLSAPSNPTLGNGTAKITVWYIIQAR